MFLLRQAGATSMPNMFFRLVLARLKEPSLFFGHLQVRVTGQDSSATAVAWLVRVSDLIRLNEKGSQPD